MEELVPQLVLLLALYLELLLVLLLVLLMVQLLVEHLDCHLEILLVVVMVNVLEEHLDCHLDFLLVEMMVIQKVLQMVVVKDLLLGKYLVFLLVAIDCNHHHATTKNKTNNALSNHQIDITSDINGRQFNTFNVTNIK